MYQQDEEGGCSTFVVGRKASTTGRVLVAHSEDNGGRILCAQHFVPADDHSERETILFEPAGARIPQVAHTLAFYWSETLSPKGASFADSFVNEAGLVICSDNCTGVYLKDQPVKDGGIGYGIRRLAAERATSARDAVRVIGELLNTYGYFDEGRTYTVADSQEAWQVAVHRGGLWLACRVPDDEVVFIPNNFKMNRVDLTDTENVQASPNLVKTLIDAGRYQPAVKGDYSDFNWREAVALPERWEMAFNFVRNQIAHQLLTGELITDPAAFPWSTKVDHQIAPEDLKIFLRAHEPHLEEERDGWLHKAGNGICRPTSHESWVCETNDDPLYTVLWRALSHPCESPYIPLYPLASPAKATHFMRPGRADREHFRGDPRNFSFKRDWPVAIFDQLSNILDFERPQHEENEDLVQAWEDDMEPVRLAAQKEAKFLETVSKAKARERLHAFNVEAFEEAFADARARLQDFTLARAAILADTIHAESAEPVSVVLFGSQTFAADKVDVQNIRAGLGRMSADTKITMNELATPLSVTVEDVDGDGVADVKLTFAQKDLARFMLPGAVYDVWFYVYADGKPIAAMDTAFIHG